MKKVLYFLPLLVLFFIPNIVNASKYPPTHVYYYDSGLTEAQKKEYVDLVMNSDIYKNNIENYNNYTLYFMNTTYQVSSTPMVVNDALMLTFYSTTPSLSHNSTNVTIPTSSSSTVSYIYKLNTSEWVDATISGGITLFKTSRTSSGKDYFYHIGFYKDYLLSSNLNLSLLFNLDVYDMENKNLGLFPEGTNLFAPYTFQPPVNDNNNDILDGDFNEIFESENILYNLSKELIGPLPLEFHFIYSIVTLLLGVVMILVIISPFVLLKRWLM